jgi:zinc-ribbon domain
VAFCGNCGSTISPGVRFCSKCGVAIPGAPAQPAVAAPPAPAPPLAPPAPISSTPFSPVPGSPAPPAPQSGGSALKIILIIVAVFVFLMLLVAGGCFYVAYRVKQKAHEFSQQMGADATPYTGKRNPCLVSSSEVAAILGTPVEAAVSRGDSACEYRFSGGNNQSLNVQFTWQGGAMTMKLAHGAMQHMVAGVETFTAVPNTGDEAYIAPGGSGFMMRKGDVMVNMELVGTGVSADAAAKIAAKIADRL